MAKSYAVRVEVGRVEKPILTFTVTRDGSFSLADRIDAQNLPIVYKFIQIPFPIDRVGVGKVINVSKPMLYSRNKPKLSHHAGTGLFHISSANSKPGYKILSGFTELGIPKGLGNQSTRLVDQVNDGGPIVSVLFWGLDKMPTVPVRSSEEIIFSQAEIRDQAMGGDGKRKSIVVHLFHWLKSTSAIRHVSADWARYPHKLYKKPLLVRIIDPGSTHNFLFGIACMAMRSDDQKIYGYRMGGGPGIVDQEMRTCTNTNIFFEMPPPQIFNNEVSLDFSDGENFNDKTPPFDGVLP